MTKNSSISSWIWTSSMRFFHRCLHDVSSPLFWHDVMFEVVISGSVGCAVIWVLMSLNPMMYTLSTTHFAFFAIALTLAYADSYSSINRTLFNPAIVFAVFVTGRISFTRSESDSLLTYLLTYFHMCIHQKNILLLALQRERNRQYFL